MKIFFYIFLIIFFLFEISISQEKSYFLSLKHNKVNVRYGPDLNSPIKYIYKKKNLPVKIIDKKENFRRIVDFKKNSGWVHISQLKKKGSIILLKDKILFSKPTIYSKPIIKIKTGRLLIVKKCQKTWCNVITENYLGWLKTDNVWGQ